MQKGTSLPGGLASASKAVYSSPSKTSLETTTLPTQAETTSPERELSYNINPVSSVELVKLTSVLGPITALDGKSRWLAGTSHKKV